MSREFLEISFVFYVALYAWHVDKGIAKCLESSDIPRSYLGPRTNNTSTSVRFSRNEFISQRFSMERLRVLNLSFHPSIRERVARKLRSLKMKRNQTAKKTLSSVLGEFLSNVVKNFKKLVGKKTEQAVRSRYEERMKKRSDYGKKLFDRVRRRLLNHTTVPNDPAIIMKLDIPTAYAMYKPPLVNFLELFIEHGYEIRFSGGTVRDIISGRVPHVLNFATVAKPDQMRKMMDIEEFHVMEIKSRNPSTLAIRYDGMKFRVSTLINEMSTMEDSTFEADWETDAASRDFTVNAMYLGLDGSLYDYFNGYDDLKNGKIVFIGVANKRIQGDFVRIIKYFRMMGTVVDDPTDFDNEAITAIKKNAYGIGHIPGKTLWREFQQIFFGNHVLVIIKTMLDLGLSQYLGLGFPSELDIKSFEYFCSLPDRHRFRPLTYVGALLHTPAQIHRFAYRMYLSDLERELLTFVVTHKNRTSQATVLDQMEY